uniref:Metalloendopeptidase n=1 Tax=Syphacia muris TaxID=451379 RepID=A0A0N5AUP2_9BILA
MSMQLVDEQNDDADSSAMYNSDRFEGDIAMDLNATTVKLFLNGAISSTDLMFNAVKNRHQLWPNGRIPYTLSSQYSVYSRSVIAGAMQEYTKLTCIQWVPKTNTDVNYVYIMPDRGCYSMVGKTGGRQTLSLGSGCIQKGIIIHELMHAVGFFHEQSRTDRDDYITIMWNNIQPGMQGQFEKYGHGTIQTLGVDYDYDSIMHYGSRAFSRNGQPTIVPKQASAKIGQRSGFSKLDALKINRLYECSAGNFIWFQCLKYLILCVEVCTSTTPLVPSTKLPFVTTPYPPQPTLIPYTPIIITLPPITTRPTTTTTTAPTTAVIPVVKVISEVCKDTRRDCPQLAQQVIMLSVSLGWCKRNPIWMKQYCPVSCNFCEKKPEVCEDLRVDCTKLVQSRYCHTSQNFMKTYCAKSCGFCFVPPATEIPDTFVSTKAPTTTPPTIPSRITTARPKATSTDITTTTLKTTPKLPPVITIWPILKPWVTPEISTAQPIIGGPTTSTSSCKDLKHFCTHWKNAGFCEGIFSTYMKRNCPKSCNFC